MSWDWGNFLSEMIATVVGGLLSFLAGYVIFVLDQRNRKSEEKDRLKAEEKLEKIFDSNHKLKRDYKEIKKMQDLDLEWLNKLVNEQKKK